MKLGKITTGLMVVGFTSLFAFSCPMMQNNCGQNSCNQKSSKCKVDNGEKIQKMRSFMDLNLSSEQQNKIYQLLNDEQKNKFKQMQERHKFMKECYDKCHTN